MDKLIDRYPHICVKGSDPLGNCWDLYGELEGDGATEIVVLGKKTYHCGTKSGSKGFGKKLISMDLFKKVIYEGPQKVEYATIDRQIMKNKYVFIGLFKQTHRTLRVNIPKLKQKCPKCKLFITKHVVTELLC